MIEALSEICAKSYVISMRLHDPNPASEGYAILPIHMHLIIKSPDYGSPSSRAVISPIYASSSS
jgi:hypothetical protein